MHASEATLAAVGSRISVVMSTGAQLEGDVSGRDGEWLMLETEQGPVALNRAQIVMIAGAGVPLTPAAKPTAARARSAQPGRPWTDDELRMLADAFLDGAPDKELANGFGRTPAIIKQLRQAFEIARGNLDEDQATDIAVSWVPRWRRVLAG